MPFTLSHPAIVLPLAKRLSYTGLIIGSMSPDFEYFINFKIQSIVSHTILGIFIFCLPISLIVSFIFHYFIKNILIYNLPSFFQKRFFLYLNLNWKIHFRNHWNVIIFSIILGAISHILWDSFTHYDGYFVEKIPLLKETLFQIPLYKILQHSSTFIGGVYIIYFITKLPEIRPFIKKEINSKYWILVMMISLIVFIIRFYLGSFSIGNAVVTTISALFIALTLAPIILKNFKIL